MVTLRLFPPGLSCARSPWPLWNATTLEPPPPQPSFFTLNSSLKGKQRQCRHPLKEVNTLMWVCSFFLPVIEGDCQFSLQHFLIAFGEQAEELCLEGGLQEAVVLGLMKDEKVILSCTAHNTYRRPLKKITIIKQLPSMFPVDWLWKLTRERCNNSAMHAVVNLFGSLEWETLAFPLFIQFLKLANHSSQFQEGHVSDYYFNYLPVTVAPCSVSSTKSHHS